MAKATYEGPYDQFRVDGHVLRRGVPVEVPDDIAELLRDRSDIRVETAKKRKVAEAAASEEDMQ